MDASYCYKFLERACPILTWHIDSRGAGFLAKRIRRIPVTVVVRNIAFGSYLDRHPEAVPGEILIMPEIEYYLDLDGGRDRRFFRFTVDRHLQVYNAKASLKDFPAKIIPFEEIVPEGMNADRLWEQFFPPVAEDPKNVPWGIPEAALRVAKAFSKAWAMCGAVQVNMKMSFGVDCLGNANLMHLFRASSWRLWPEGFVSEHPEIANLYIHADREGRPLSELSGLLKSDERWFSQQVVKFAGLARHCNCRVTV